MENFEPRNYFYRIIELHSEKAEGLMNSLKTAFEAEQHQFADYLKRRLIGYASDGAPVMTGAVGGLGTLIDQWAGRTQRQGQPAPQYPTLYKVHCCDRRGGAGRFAIYVA